MAGEDVTPMLLFVIFSAVLGMFQFGFNTGVINAPQKVLEEFIANVYKSRTGDWISEELRDFIWSITVSVFAIGGMLGGILAPTVANWCGRKTGLVLNNTVAVLGVTLMSSSQLAQSIECLIFGRFFIGLNCGLNTALVPMYLTEIATVNLRGALGTVSQLGVTIGLLFSQVLGLKNFLGTKDLWPFLFGFAFVPAILQLIMLPFCPESPRYLLISCNRVHEARFALRRLRHRSADVENEIEEMRAEERSNQEEVRKYGRMSSVRELFNHPWLRAPLIIGMMMQLSQQLSGINAIFYYSTDIFLSAEVPEDYAVYATIGVGAIMVIMTLVSIPLMDRLGRRTLHLYGLAGMFLASIFLTISLLVKFLYDWMKYISVISILFYTLFFGIGPGSIPLMITAELFTQGTRPAAMSVSVLVNWFSNFAVGLTFPLMKRVLQSYLFLPFTVFLAIFWIFTYKKLPETKNRTFEEIAALFRPIHLGAPGVGPGGGFPGGYRSTNYALHESSADGHPAGLIAGQSSMTPVSPTTPMQDGGGGGTIADSGSHQQGQTSSALATRGVISDGATIDNYKMVDRFRFDHCALASHNSNNSNTANSQFTSTCAHTGSSGDCQMASNKHLMSRSATVTCNGACYGSQGNLNNLSDQSNTFLPHISCTSIAQNLSTSDIQPLIVDAQHDDPRFYAKTLQHHHNTHNHHHHNHFHHLHNNAHINMHKNNNTNPTYLQQQQQQTRTITSDKGPVPASQPKGCTCMETTTSFINPKQQEQAALAELRQQQQQQDLLINPNCTFCGHDNDRKGAVCEPIERDVDVDDDVDENDEEDGDDDSIFSPPAHKPASPAPPLPPPPLDLHQTFKADLVRRKSSSSYRSSDLADRARYSSNEYPPVSNTNHHHHLIAYDPDDDSNSSISATLQQLRSRTLTRIYKPLNDIHLKQHLQNHSSASTHNLLVDLGHEADADGVEDEDDAEDEADVDDMTDDVAVATGSTGSSNNKQQNNLSIYRQNNSRL